MPTKDFRQTATPKHFNGKRLEDNVMNVVNIKIFKEITVIRYLMSKLFYIEEEFTLEEATVLFVAFEQFSKKMSSDEALRRKYGSELFTFRAIFQSLNNFIGRNPQRRIERLQQEYEFYLRNKQTFLTKRNYFSIKGQIRKFFEAKIKTRFPQKFPPKAYIAKGYGDHGTAKNPAADGSPSWQEVASCLSDEELNRNTRIDREINFFKNLQVHRLQLLYL